jgi:DNA-binding response OmpR family regulator
MALSPSRSILIIDDDQDSSIALSAVLSKSYDIKIAASGEEGVRLARTHLPDLILLDLLMPGMDGTLTCKTLRLSDLTRHIPIIIITSSCELDPKVDAFMNGADDMIQKPFEQRELLARIHSKMRRLDERKGTPSHAIECGNLTLNPVSLEVTINGNVIPISVLEFNLLRFFLENPDRVVSRDQILAAVWKDAIVSDRTVDTHMASLRRKLTQFNHTFRTIYSAGYILKKKPPHKRDGSSRRKSAIPPTDANGGAHHDPST